MRAVGLAELGRHGCGVHVAGVGVQGAVIDGIRVAAGGGAGACVGWGGGAAGGGAGVGGCGRCCAGLWVAGWEVAVDVQSVAGAADLGGVTWAGEVAVSFSGLDAWTVQLVAAVALASVLDTEYSRFELVAVGLADQGGHGAGDETGEVVDAALSDGIGVAAEVVYGWWAVGGGWCCGG